MVVFIFLFDQPTPFNFECFQCCCRVCTHRRCPYSKSWFGPYYQYRCAECFSGSCNRPSLDCDFFENRHTVGYRFRFRLHRREKGEIEKRLDAIMKAVGAELPDDSKKGD